MAKSRRAGPHPRSKAWHGLREERLAQKLALDVREGRVKIEDLPPSTRAEVEKFEEKWLGKKRDARTV